MIGNGNTLILRLIRRYFRAGVDYEFVRIHYIIGQFTLGRIKWAKQTGGFDPRRDSRGDQMIQGGVV